MKTSESVQQICPALARAQGKFRNVDRDNVALVTPRDKTKQPYSFAYADLGAVLDIVRGPLAEEGLALVQPAIFKDGDVVVTTKLFHASGEWMDFGDFSMTPDRPGPQAIGSCVTYARRYAATAALGIAQYDDDANEAEGNKVQSSSLSSIIAKLDASESYDDFRQRWSELPRAERDELAKRKPKQIQLWKDKFKGDDDADQSTGEVGEGVANEDREAAATESF